MRRPPAFRLVLLLLSVAGCGDSTGPGDGRGSLRLSLAMAGPDPDPNGVLVSVDGAPPTAVAADRSVTLTVAAGSHSVQLTGLAENCSSGGTLPRSVEVRRGEVSSVTFSVTCKAASGVVEVAVAIQGQDLDSDGYLVRVDSGPAQRMPGGATTRFAPVSGGVHTVTVSDLTANCTVVGANPVTGVRVGAGGAVRDTARVLISIACTGRTGSLRVITRTSGFVDPADYVLGLRAPSLQGARLKANDSLLVPNLPVGPFPLEIVELGGYCRFAATPPGAVTIASGDTTEVLIALDCVPPGLLRVTAPTSGSDPDPGYQVKVDGGYPAPLVAGGTLSLHLTPGAHAVELSDVAPNCRVAGANPASVTVSTTVPAELAFPVTCTAAARTGMDITITTTGSDPDDQYTLYLCQSDWDVCFPSFSEPVPATASLQLDLAPGDYEGSYLGDVANNCQYTWTGGRTVAAGRVTQVQIAVTCVARLSFEATVTTSGSDPQEWFELSVDGQPGVPVAAGVPTAVASWVGAHTIGLPHLQANCRINGSNPVSVTLTPGVVTPVRFAVDCEPFPVLTVSVSTAGDHQPANYLVGVDPDWDGVRVFGYSTQITANGTVTLRLNPGSHVVWLTQVAANCAVTGSNPLTVNATLGGTTELAFAVTCQ